MYQKYLIYLLRHKWFVFIECARLGIPFAGIIHDWQKFLPVEFVPYAKSFYGKWKYNERPQWLIDSFNYAWLHHQHYGAHHWQHWILRNDDGTTHCLPMPNRYVLEMIADWWGTGRAIKGKPKHGGDRYVEMRIWYDKNKDKIQLSPITRLEVENIIARGG